MICSPVDCYSVKQTIVSDCSVVASIGVAAQVIKKLETSHCSFFDVDILLEMIFDLVLIGVGLNFREDAICNRHFCNQNLNA